MWRPVLWVTMIEASRTSAGEGANFFFLVPDAVAASAGRDQMKIIYIIVGTYQGHIDKDLGTLSESHIILVKD